MRGFFLSGVRSGLRGRSFQAVLILGFFLVGAAYLSAGFSPRHPRTVALDIGLSGIRITLVLLSLFWIQELLAKEVERKTILHSLAYPAVRALFVLGRYFAVVALAAVAALALGLSLLGAVAVASDYSQEFPVLLGYPFWITLGGLLLDVAVVAAVGAALATVSTTPVLPLAVGLAFAIGAKALGATLDYIGQGADGDTRILNVFGPVVGVVRWIVPDLSRLDWRDWPMYGLPPVPSEVGWAVAAATSYGAAALTIGILYFSRREFS